MAKYQSSLTGPQMDAALVAMPDAEAYARGTRNGQDVPASDPTYQNNAKYYAQLAQSAFPETYATGAVRGDIAQTAQTEAWRKQARANIQAGGTNPNLLDNPWFTIDQRQGYIQIGGTMMYSDTACTQEWGVSVNTTPVKTYGTYARPIDNGVELALYIKMSDLVRGYLAGYCVDRWRHESLSQLTVNDNGISFVSGNWTGGIARYFEKEFFNRLSGKDITISIMETNGTVHSHTISGYDPSQSYWETTDSYISVIFERDYTTSAGRLRFVNSGASKTYNIRAVKLEIGTVSTLANDAPPNYAEELLKCQRYFWRFSGTLPSNKSSETATVYRTWLQFPVTMRAVPAISNTSFYEATKTIDGYNTTVHGIYLYNTNTQSFVMTGADFSADL